MILPDMDEETEMAGQSILPHNINEEEVNIDAISLDSESQKINSIVFCR